MLAGLIDVFSKPFRTFLQIILFFKTNVCFSLYMPVHMHNHSLAGRTYSCRKLQQYIRHMFFIVKSHSCFSIYDINLTSNILICFVWLVVYCMCASFTHSFIHSSFIGMCRMQQFLAVLRIFFHSSLLCTLYLHSIPPTSLPSFLTLSRHLFLGLPLMPCCFQIHT